MSQSATSASPNKIQNLAHNIINHISQTVIGKQEQILLALTCLVAGGHLLLEDLPGVGKTTLAKALASTINGQFRRVQCTPDLMPSDITGVTVYNQKLGEFEFIQGPVFTHILLADEINRTSPRTQSALLEAMSDATVSIDNQTYSLPQPFFVVATQNPIEFSGTYDLPEAQMDRFMMRLSLGYPDFASEISLLKTHGANQSIPTQALISPEQILKLRALSERVPVSEEMYRYIGEIILRTRQHSALRLGASPRAGLSLLRACQSYALLTGATSVQPAHVQRLAQPVLAHRLIFKNQSSSDEVQAQFFAQLLQTQVRVPDNPTNPNSGHTPAFPQHHTNSGLNFG